MKKFLSLFLMSALLFVGCKEDPATYTITVNAGENGTAKADVAMAEEGATVTLTATPDEGYEFAGWTAVSGGATFTDAEATTTTFKMPAGNVEINAAFIEKTGEEVEFTVTVNAGDNGTATADPTKAVEGATVTLTATPAAGYEFAGWTVVSENVTLEDAMAATSTFAMPAENVEFGAAFTEVDKPKFTITVNGGENGTAEANIEEAAEGATITLTATPNEGYSFGGWTVVSENVTLEDPAANPATFTMPAENVEFTATYAEFDVYTAITDAILKEWMLGSDGRFDTNKDGILSVEEAAAVETMNIPADRGIESLAGVEYFTGLTRLQFTENRISSIDLSKLTKLQILLCATNSLTELDLSNNPDLTQLTISYNPISTLDLSKQTKLERLTAYDCDMSQLDLSYNTALTQVDCADNGLASINLPQTNTLTRLVCYGNQLTSLDLSTLPGLTAVMCNNNQLSQLNLSANTALTSISAGNNKFTTIDVSNCENLQELLIGNNQLSSLDLSGNQKLLRLTIDNNKFATIDVSAAQALENLYCNNNQLTSLDVSGNPKLYQVVCTYNRLTSFKASENITYLECQNNSMLSLDLSGYPKLNVLKCFGNRLSTLDASNMLPSSFDGYFALSCGNQSNGMGGYQPLTLTLGEVHKELWNSSLQYEADNANVVLAQ